MTFAAALLNWYDEHPRTLPWRNVGDPYRVWLSEVMLQQTQIATVLPYYERFTTRYPTVYALAAAPLDDILKLWEGLGYYSRARNLHRAAQEVVTRWNGEFPRTVTDLLTLPGIGRYTAGAIASIAFEERAAVLDGNVIRVLSRIDDLTLDVTQPAHQRTLWQRAESLLPAERVGDYNQALMGLGREVCRPRAPLCEACPVSGECSAYRAGTQAERPVKAKKAPIPHYDVAAGVITNEPGQLLIAQRPTDGLLGGLWEFPGGKRESGETLPECLQRELREELAIEVTVADQIAAVKHAFTHFKITLFAFACKWKPEAGDPQALGCAAWRWAWLEELDQYAFGKADLEVIRVLRARAIDR
jgi:A/G-specific adenine glycosylase